MNISSAHLETAKTPPFIDPKQERATNTGTAKEKSPISRSAKVCQKRERNTQWFFIKWEDNCPLLTNFHGVSYTPSLQPSGNCAGHLLPLLWEQSYCSWAVLPSPLRACGRSPVEAIMRRWNQALTHVNLDHHGSKEDDQAWMDQGLICTPRIFFLQPSLNWADTTHWYSPSIHALG